MPLLLTGSVANPLSLSAADLAALPAAAQIADVSRLDPKRAGRAVKLSALLELAQPNADAQYLTLHADRDDFHASLPLAAIRDRAVVIYELNAAPLPEKAGGPYRFLIPDHAACHTAEIDDCANVKYVARLELSATRGHDNRPLEDQAHEELHRRQAEQS